MGCNPDRPARISNHSSGGSTSRPRTIRAANRSLTTIWVETETLTSIRRLTSAGFTNASVRFTHQPADGMHSAIIQATKPDGSAPARQAWPRGGPPTGRAPS
jgi:hypothetical protein